MHIDLTNAEDSSYPPFKLEVFELDEIWGKTKKCQ